MKQQIQSCSCAKAVWILLWIHMFALYIILWFQPHFLHQQHQYIPKEYQDPDPASLEPCIKTNQQAANRSMHELQQLISAKVNSTDARLIRLVREMMDPPSNHGPMKFTHQLRSTPQSNEVDGILKQQEKGFFIEVGALDGERSSNTAFFEAKRGWRGLLIEADPFFYQQVRGKNRRTYTINACLSPTGQASFMHFKESGGGTGQLVSSKKNALGFKVPCIPLETMLLALGRTRVDFFSLDVEGVELAVLKSIPWNLLDIHTLAVEYSHIPDGEKALVKYMEKQWYSTAKRIYYHEPKIDLYVDDYIFVKNNWS